MLHKSKAKGLLNRKLEDPEYQRRHEESYAAFKLEVQILNALEQKNMTYEMLAQATHTSRSNISRDLTAGGILTAGLLRISRIAEALGMRLIALLVPKENERFILSGIEDLMRTSTDTASGLVKTTGLVLSPATLSLDVKRDDDSITRFVSADATATGLIYTAQPGGLGA